MESVDLIEELTMEERGEVFTALIHKCFDGKEPELSRVPMMAYRVLLTRANMSLEAYEKRKEKDRQRIERWRKKQNVTLRNVTERSDTLRTRIDIDIDKDIDKDKDRYIDSKLSISTNSNKEILTNVSKESAPEKTKSEVKRFIKPTLEEVKKRITEKGYMVDAEQWYSYYESNGWMVGRYKMKSWQASLAYWNSKGMGNRRSGAYRHPTALDTSQIEYKQF